MTINAPANPTRIATILWPPMRSPRSAAAMIAVNKGDVNWSAATSAREIFVTPKNHATFPLYRKALRIACVPKRSVRKIALPWRTIDGVIRTRLITFLRKIIKRTE